MALRLGPRDRQILSFVADHQLVLEEQIAALVGCSVERLKPRLRELDSSRYLRRVVIFDQACCQIRRAGSDAVGSRLPVRRPQLPNYKHDVGVAWLWLAARRGAFGQVSEVLSERRLLSHDKSAAAADEPYAIRLGDHYADGRERRHYPDLLLIDPQGRRFALELELSRKGMTRRETIIAGYGADRRVQGVVYLVEDNSDGRAIGRSVHATAARMRLLDRLQVRLICPIRGGGDEILRPALEAARVRHGISRPQRAAAEAGR